MTNQPLSFIDTLENMVTIAEALILSPLVIFLLILAPLLFLARKAL